MKEFAICELQIKKKIKKYLEIWKKALSLQSEKVK